MRRAIETARIVCQHVGLPDVRVDHRLRERMNWDGSVPLDTFLREWSRTDGDRNYAPALGDSSKATGDRYLAVLNDVITLHPGERVVVVGHGGATIDVLRSLISDDELECRAPGLIEHGPTPCAVSTLVRSGQCWEVLGINHLP